MREKYYSKKNILEKSEQFRSILENSGLSRGEYTIPSTTALIVLDMQDYFLKPESHAFIPSAEAIIPRINLLIEEFNKRNMAKFYTQHIDQNESEGMMGVWWNKNLLNENPLKSISSDLKIDKMQKITKSQYDAFWNTELEKMLTKRSITDIIITGVMTHLCCETTARSAFVRGFNVIFTIDGTATYNEEHQMGSLRNLAHGFAHVETIEEVIKSLP
ncbi:MAG: isochorismatase family protein [Chloroflexi bacterium]|jgi:isochorismate hydrolase|nr:isochorismatase family protein [Chloroflexota bacterium]MBT4002163.1 isochorismatase family protein [Chloroflexota bacterium]MBT4306633.1 isochorismatase family protein [Chloroflexota bacterium]MBT4533773.1 isochorismatase family protein [Chloroflexota bacterium]MBT4681583.1 isochorismatase family protein [Chloroflexota bacterium]